RDSTADMGTPFEVDPGHEGGLVQIGYECGDNAITASLMYSNLTTGDTGSYGLSLDATQEGIWREDPEANMGDPGDFIQVHIECYGGTVSAPVFLAASTPEAFAIFDAGASGAIPDSVVGAANAISGTCGTAITDSVEVFAFADGGDGSDLIFDVTGIAVGGDGSFSSALPAVAAAGFYDFVFACWDSAYSVEDPSVWRSGSFTVSAVGSPVQESLPSETELPVTGADSGLLAGLAVGLLAAGGLALAAGVRLARRRG
ncbi:MAG: hypothetical protein J7484_13415, partial [Microbacterium sp.]|nr:hypothetical protein [Microbacterium sp.]